MNSKMNQILHDIKIRMKEIDEIILGEWMYSGYVDRPSLTPEMIRTEWATSAYANDKAKEYIQLFDHLTSLPDQLIELCEWARRDHQTIEEATDEWMDAHPSRRVSLNYLNELDTIEIAREWSKLDQSLAEMNNEWIQKWTPEEARKREGLGIAFIRLEKSLAQILIQWIQHALLKRTKRKESFETRYILRTRKEIDLYRIKAIRREMEELKLEIREFESERKRKSKEETVIQSI